MRRLELLPTLVAGGAFDAVVYTMGNNEFHRPFLDLLRLVPGHVLFHDVRLIAGYTPLERHAMGERFYRGRVDTPLYAAEIADLALTSMVQSAHAAALFEADTGIPSVNVGPHPMTVVDASLDEGAEIQIVSMGIADVIKQTDKFVRAADDVLARHPDWNAAIVGLGGRASSARDRGSRPSAAPTTRPS